eukprot:scaffold2654_cov126-Cylindrotheca_fusiformis.AAC.11
MAHSTPSEKDLGRLVTQLFFPDFFPHDHSKSWTQQTSLVVTRPSNPNKIELLVSELSFNFQMFLQDIGLGKSPYTAVSTVEEEEYEFYDDTPPRCQKKENERRPSLFPPELSSSFRNILEKDDDDSWMSPKPKRKDMKEGDIDHGFYFDLSHLDEE